MSDKINPAIIDEVIREIGRKYGAVCAYKLQKGDKENKAVLQVALIFREKPSRNIFHDIFQELSEKLSLTNIDLVIMNNAPLTITYIILKQGTQVYCDDQEILKRFKAKIVEEYLDFRNEVRGHTEISLEKARS